MSLAEDEKINKIFKGYLTESNIKEDIADKIIKLAENYEHKNKQSEFLHRFEHTLKKSYDQKNNKMFISTCKRFLFIINKLLQRDCKKEKQRKYTKLISEQIIEYYLFFFSIIFKHSLLDLTIDLKMYRMRWVKRITDTAFIRLKQEIVKKFKFNLDKGFSQENLQKLKIIHKKRGLNEKQSNRYLGLDVDNVGDKHVVTKDHSSEESGSGSSNSEEDQYDQVKKKIKINHNIDQNYYNQLKSNGNLNVNGNYFIQPPGVYNDNQYYYEKAMSQVYDPRKKQESGQISSINHNHNQAMLNASLPYFPYPVQQKEQIREIKEPLKNFNQISGVNYQGYLDFHGKIYNEKIGLNYGAQLTDYSLTQKNSLIIEKLMGIRQKLQKNLIKCRQCGQLFQTNNLYEKHVNQHFFESLARVSESDNKTKSKKQPKLRLFDIKSWQADILENEKQLTFQILLSQLSHLKISQKIRCLFCNEQFQKVFSPVSEQWALSDAVKIQSDDRVNIMHFGCYECFKSEENSPVFERQ